MKTETRGELTGFFDQGRVMLYGDIVAYMVKQVYRMQDAPGKRHGEVITVLRTKRPHAYARRRTNPQYREQWMRSQ